MALCIPSPSVSSTGTDARAERCTHRAGQGCGCRQSCSGRTQVAIWSPSPQAPPICQAPALLLGPLLASGHPPPTLPVSSSSSALSPSHFLPSFLSSSPANHLLFLPALSQSASFPPPFLGCSLPSSPRPLFPQSCSSFSSPSQSAPARPARPISWRRLPTAGDTLGGHTPSTTKFPRPPSLTAPRLLEGMARYRVHILLGIRTNQSSSSSNSS